MKTVLSGIVAMGFLSQALFAQGDNTRATPMDWEEINFAFNQAVLVDGFPSLLRLAELLKQHPDYKVTLAGNTDQIGGNRANQALSLKRANAVAAFLEKYGANTNQITVKGDGKMNLEVNAANENARFMNRRVVITVTTPTGEVIGDGSITSAINEFQTYARAQLGKIDGILAELQRLEAEVRALNTADIKQDTAQIRQDSAAIRQDTQSLKQDTAAIKQDTAALVQRPAPLTDARTTEIAQAAANYALTQTALRNQKYSLIGFDAGPTFMSGRTGNYSGDVFAKGLIPFGNGQTPDQNGTHGIQLDGTWDYFHPRSGLRDGVSDGIFDIGLVNRFDHFQVGTFAQFDYTNFSLYHGGGLLGAGILTLDFVMPGGRIGVFGGKGFREEANLGTIATTVTAANPLAYIRYEDQVGVQGEGALGSHLILDASVAYKKRYLAGASKVPAATVKVTMPITNMFAIYFEADQNYTFQNYVTGDRAVFGIQFGNWLRPSNYGTTTGVVPVSVPMPHYELLAR